jgi:hypothetical protein
MSKLLLGRNVKKQLKIKNPEVISKGELDDYINTYESKRTSLEVKDTNLIEKKVIIPIDSRDRDKIQYPSAYSFQVELSPSYNNIKSVRLVSTEFPNSNSIITSSNNFIYWINEEDRDLEFPMYSIEISPGYYTAYQLQTKITTLMNTTKRRNGNGDFHYFVVGIDEQTDIVSFKSYIITLLAANPITTTINSSVLSVSHTNHGLSVGDIIVIINASTIGGISQGVLNSTFVVGNVIDPNTYEIEINFNANQTLTGGGNNVKIGKLSNFKLLFGTKLNNPSKLLGFDYEDTGINTNGVLSGFVLDINSVVLGPSYTTVVSINHSLQVGDIINLSGIVCSPPLSSFKNYFQVINVVNSNIFFIDAVFTTMDPLSSASKIHTSIFKLTTGVPHLLNSISSIIDGGLVPATVTNEHYLTVTTTFDHNKSVGSYVKLVGSGTAEGVYQIDSVLSPDSFRVIKINGIATAINTGYIDTNSFRLYNISTAGGVNIDVINNIEMLIRDLPSENEILFNIYKTFPDTGGDYTNENIYISSNIHGFKGTIDNTEEGTVNRHVKLQGEDYCFLCCPTLASIPNSQYVSDIFAKIVLSQPPNTIIFNSYVSAPKMFWEGAYPFIDRLLFEVKIYDGSYFDFNRLDYSFTIEITYLQEISNEMYNSSRLISNYKTTLSRA